MLLAKAGIKVTILEKSDDVGGRTRGFEKDGYRFDNGPTFFHYPEIIEEIFESIGMDAREELGLIPLDPNYRLVFGAGGSLNATTDLDDMVSQIDDLCAEKNATGFRRYIEDKRKKLRMSKNCLGFPAEFPRKRKKKALPAARLQSSPSGNC